MSEVSNRRFVHFDGTKQEFIDGGYPDQYQESIVFINEDGNESNSTIYTHGEYYGQGVIVEGDASNSAVLKGEYDGHKNKALSPSSIAIGVGTTSGLKGYYYKALHLNTNRNVFYLYLSRTQQKPKLITSYNEITPETDIDIDLEINDVITIVNGDTFDDMFYIYGNDIKTYGRITIRSRSNDYFPFKDILTNDNIDNGIFNLDDYCIYSKHKPSAGLAPLPSQGSFAEGYFTVTRGIGSHAEGKYNKHNDFTLHSVGIGTSDTNRKNAHEITTDGKHYILNVGDYDGTNPSTNNDVATVLPNMINISYSELVSLRNDSKLVSGQQYRITDYVTTTTQELTLSLGQQFDVIVTANSSNSLDENAKVCKSDAEDVVKIEMINDKFETEWLVFETLCDIESVYYSQWISERGERLYADVYFDQESRDIILIAKQGTPIYDFTWTKKGEMFIIQDKTYFKDNNIESWIIKYCLDNDNNRFAWADNKKGKGVIYYMKDEFNNECPYDFKNILYDNNTVNNIIHTFCEHRESEKDGYDTVDLSLKGEYCHNNTIKPYYDNGIQRLNSILFYNYYNSDFESIPYCFSNVFGEGCYNNIFGRNCRRNEFGTEIYNCNIGDDFYLNVLGDKCYGNTFGSECSGNTFGEVCSLNVIMNKCTNNVFGNVCHSNKIGNDFSHNILLNNCHHNTFGSTCSSNKFGTGCYDNVFGNNFARNDIGSLFNGNNFNLDYVQYNTIHTGVRNCTFTNSETPSTSNQIQRYKINTGLYNKTIQLNRKRSYVTTITSDSSGNIRNYNDDIIIGNQSSNAGQYANTFGLCTKTTNIAEFACGQYNYSTAGTLFSIGNGSSTERKNIVEVRNDDILLWSEDKQGYIKLSDLLKKKLINVYDKNGISLYDINDVYSLLKGGIYMPPSGHEILYLIFHATSGNEYCIPIYPNSRNCYTEYRFHDKIIDDGILINIIETHDYVMLSDYSQKYIAGVKISYTIDASCANVYEIKKDRRLVFNEPHEYITEDTTKFHFSNIGEFSQEYEGTVIDRKYACCTISGNLDYLYPYNCIINDNQFEFNANNSVMSYYHGVIFYVEGYNYSHNVFAPATEYLIYSDGYTLNYTGISNVHITYGERSLRIDSNKAYDFKILYGNDNLALIKGCDNVRTYDDIGNWYDELQFSIDVYYNNTRRYRYTYTGSGYMEQIVDFVSSDDSGSVIKAWLYDNMVILISSLPYNDWTLYVTLA